MSRSSVLITGGAGFIGSEFVRQCVESETYSDIYVIDSLTYAADLNRIQDALDGSKIEFIQCDISDIEKYQNVLKSVNHIAHFAAESHVDRSNENGMPFLQSNVIGTYALLEAARFHSQIRTLLVSTDEVYGSIDEGLFSEISPLNPSSAYSASKASSDFFGLAMNHTFNQDIVITRGCNTYGPFQHAEKLIPLCISKLLQGTNAPLYGDGNNIREWIHVSDHARAIQSVILNGTAGEIYNIGSGFRLSNREVLSHILTELKLDWGRVDFVADRPGHDKRYALDFSKIKKETQWEAQIDFLNGIKTTVDWYRRNHVNP
ncbi:dTDP-glucose 4,6-dehydratase [Candidatus Planktophila dulcis]|uniref:dTDP-glucose 4,6-dehydratase n=1 Tax=Candidatus Planktophila dulcis TaxID=1884914 RepID=UPI000BACB3A3|nr:dTDP-glucose 4,6-dehydratase [Candidatus Planktophila dulcis]ASY20710.1 dTDP-glucose 4,6-dehydratase [Candidatus Planktophila dulcis]